MLTIHAERHNEGAAVFCRTFLGSPRVPRYVLGRNEYAASIVEKVDIDGFIDDYTTDVVFLGKPILKMPDVPKESFVVSAVIFVLPLTAMHNLQKQGLACLDYFNFLKYSGLDIKRIFFIDQARQDISNNLESYRWNYDCLEDEASRSIFEKFVNFRYSCDPFYLLGFKNDPDGQYFESFMNFKAGEVFVDAGGFDGQTAVNFINRCPDYKSVHIFEPDPHNLAIARQRLRQFANVHFHTVGVGESRRTLRFSSGGGSASAVSDAGDMEILVDSIDQLIGEPVTTIKMDVEGWERPALRGAKNHIIQDHPKLAICCYHQFDDLVRIPEDILAMRDDYAVYLRHYTEGLHESVFYFIPRA